MDISILRDVEKFLGSLEEKTIAKVLRTIDLLEHFGHQLGLPHSKKLERNLFELRVRGKQEVRIFYTFKHRKIILIHGFVKKSPKTPPKEMKTAQKKLQLI